MKFNTLVIYLTLINIIIILFFSNILLDINKEPANSVILDKNNIQTSFNFSQFYIDSSQSTNIDIFNSYKYLNSYRYKSTKYLINDLNKLLIVSSHNKDITNQYFFSLLTDSLLLKLYPNKDSISVIKLYETSNWVQGFKFLAELDTSRNTYFEAMYDFWMNYISGSLSQLSALDKNIKFNIYFNSLYLTCNSNNYPISIKYNLIDKFVFNYLSKNYNHLLHATWNQTNIKHKLLIFIIFSFTLILYINAFTDLLKRITSKV